jgi:hypothetical protein
MKLAFCSIWAIWIVLIAGAPGRNSVVEQPDPEVDHYVRVEIRGKLERLDFCPTEPASEWEQIGCYTGLHIFGPGDQWATMGYDANTKLNPGVEWELFLGKDKALRAAAKKLEGQEVVASGMLTLIPGSRFSSGPFHPQYRLIIRVTNLQAARLAK